MERKKNLAIGVCGGIAAYKTVDLVSKLVKEGINVKVIMTESASKFVSPLTFQTISRNPVYIDMFEKPKSWNVDHISISQESDLIAIVPATANIIGKISSGIADDFLSTAVMAAHCPVALVPAMNVKMYENPINQRNIVALKNLGYKIMEPDKGLLACGDEGKGRLPEVNNIKEFLLNILDIKRDLEGIKILITAGPTIEPIDPVRFISNRSSGKMGVALAEAARDRGAQVILVHGPLSVPLPFGVSCHPIETAQEMRNKVMELYEHCNCIIKAAAVADYRPSKYYDYKIKKTEKLNIEMEKNPDILEELGNKKGDRVLIGFAAESNDLIHYGKDKLKRKNADLFVANNILNPDGGFGKDTNLVTIIYRDGKIEELPKMPKRQVGDYILTKMKEILFNKGVIQ